MPSPHQQTTTTATTRQVVLVGRPGCLASVFTDRLAGAGGAGQGNGALPRLVKHSSINPKLEKTHQAVQAWHQLVLMGEASLSLEGCMCRHPVGCPVSLGV